MKIILPWILAVAFAAGAGALYLSNSTKDTELATAHEQSKALEDLQAQAETLQKQAAAQNDEIASLRKDNEELLRLRNEVQLLRDEKRRLEKLLQSTQAQVQRSEVEVQQTQARVSETATQIAEQRILQIKQDQQNTAMCIGNMRLLQRAKQQWAQDHNQPQDAVPAPQDLVAYLPDQLFPQCPAGGHYTINAVSNLPTCSIPGHVLQ